MLPYEILPPVEIPGVGQVHGGSIQDAATWAMFELENYGPGFAIRRKKELQELIKNGGWRKEAAANALTLIERQYLIQFSYLPVPEEVR